MYCVVEFHGFKDSRNKWIVKELAIVGPLCTFNAIFASPYSKDRITCRKTRQSFAWLKRNYHKIEWEDGIIPFEYSFIKNLLVPFDVIYTKGLEKKEFLDRFHMDVREIEDTVNEESNVVCCLPKHLDNKKCALKSATMYFN